jgi:hypothetical protein
MKNKFLPDSVRVHIVCLKNSSVSKPSDLDGNEKFKVAMKIVGKLIHLDTWLNLHWIAEIKIFLAVTLEVSNFATFTEFDCVKNCR